MSTSLKLATCAEDYLAIWKLPHKEKLHQLSGGSTHVTWGYDGSTLASFGSKKPDHFSISYIKNDVCTSVEHLGPLGAGRLIKAIQYPRTSVKILSIAVEDQVLLYDVAKKKLKVEFKNVPSVSCLAMNHGDKYIAAGTNLGTVHILNSRTSRPAFKHPIAINSDRQAQTDVVTSVNFNNIKYSMMGCCSDQGHVNFFDVNTGQELHAFKEHKAPATDLAFSPVNDVLVLSSGLDKRCVCYDTMTKKPVSTIWTDWPLTAVDFALDGTNLVLGTTKGLVYLYDLRSFNSPLAVIEAHNSKVTSVKFQPGGDRANVSSLLSNLSTSSSCVDLTSTSRLLAVKENIKPRDSNTSLGSQIFSPLRGPDSLENLSFGASAVKTPVMMNHQHSSSHHSNSRFSTESLFSPLRETSLNSPLAVTGGSVLMNKTSLLSSIREESILDHKNTSYHSKYDFDHENLIDNVVKDAVDSTTVSILSGPSNNDEVDLNQENGEDQPRPPVIDQPRIKTPTKIAQQKSETVSTESSSESLMPVIISASRPLYLPASNLKEMEFESESSKTSTDPQNAVKVKDSTEKISNDTDLISKVAGPDIKALLTAFPEALSVKPDPLFNNDREEVQARKGNDHKNQNEIETFKQKYVQAAVEEAMDDFCSDMRKHLWHIQYDMIKNFQLQQLEFKKILQNYASNEELLLENAKLKEEIRRLKSTPFVGHFTNEEEE